MSRDSGNPTESIAAAVNTVGDQFEPPTSRLRPVSQKYSLLSSDPLIQKGHSTQNQELGSIKIGKGPWTAVVTDVVNPAPSNREPNTIENLESTYPHAPKREIKPIIRCRVVGIETSIFGNTIDGISGTVVDLTPRAGVKDLPKKGQIILMEYINPPGDAVTTTRQGYYLGPKYDDKNELSFVSNVEPRNYSEVCLVEGMPLIQRPEMGSPAQPSTPSQDVPPIKQARQGLKSCAEQNDWSANLTPTRLAPPEIKSGKRFYKPRPSFATVRSIVYHDGAPSIAGYVARSENSNFGSFKPFTHYYIDDVSKVHELVDPKYVTNHLFQSEISDSNNTSIGINTSQFTLNLQYIFENNVFGPKLRPEYRNLLSGDGDTGALLIGSPLFLGSPNPVGKITGKMGHDTYLIGSRKHMEVCHQLSSCLSDEFNIETSTNAVVEYTRDKLKKLKNSNLETIPFFFNYQHLKKYTFFSKMNMIHLNGVFSESRYGHGPGGLISEFYSFCRANDLSSEEAYYATLASLVCPGTSSPGAVTYVDVGSYINMFGEFYLDVSAVPAPTSTKVKDFLISVGREVYRDAEYNRRTIVRQDRNAKEQSVFGGIGSGLIAAAALTDKTPWKKISKDLLGAYASDDCLQFYNAFREKLFNYVNRFDEGIDSSSVNDYKSPIGLWVSENAYEMLKYAVATDEGKGLSGCLTNESFLNILKEEYNIKVK